MRCCIRRGTPDRIAAVGLTALWHSLLGLDAAGRPVTPVYPWSDTRATGAAARLRHELDPAEVHRRTGAALHPSYLPARLRWLDDTRPQLFRAARFWASIAEYLELRLFGQRRVSISMASGTGLLDQHTLEWDPEVLGAARIDADQLSPLVDLDCAARELAEPFRSRWPALAHVPWYPALGDGACANVGSGCIGPERIALSLGTSGALRLLDATDDPAIPPDLWCYRLDRGHALWGGAVSNGGNVYAWLRRTLHLPSPTEFEQWLCEAPADAHGLTVLPFLAGERSPFFPLGATMSIAGLTLDTPPEAIAQAAMEAVAIRLSLIRDALRAHCPGAGGSGGQRCGAESFTRVGTDHRRCIRGADRGGAGGRGVEPRRGAAGVAVGRRNSGAACRSRTHRDRAPARPWAPRAVCCRAGAPTDAGVFLTRRGNPVNTLTTDRYAPMALTALRIAAGITYFSHGAAKIFGWFGGMGPNGTVDYATRFGAAGFIEVSRRRVSHLRSGHPPDGVHRLGRNGGRVLLDPRRRQRAALVVAEPRRASDSLLLHLAAVRRPGSGAVQPRCLAIAALALAPPPIRIAAE